MFHITSTLSPSLQASTKMDEEELDEGVNTSHTCTNNKQTLLKHALEKSNVIAHSHISQRSWQKRLARYLKILGSNSTFPLRTFELSFFAVGDLKFKIRPFTAMKSNIIWIPAKYIPKFLQKHTTIPKSGRKNVTSS
jgi:hypothetical protein